MAGVISSAISIPVRRPEWILTYAGSNITADISPMVLEITYRDYVSHISDEIEVNLEDRDKRWQGPWYPGQGDLMNLQIGYAGEALLPCGDFQVDELELSGPPDVFHLKGIGAGITPSLRTPVSAGYETQTLPQIAATIAARHSLTVAGLPQTLNIQFERVTQNHETDLAFLRRLACQFNYDFSVRGSKLVFYSRTALEQEAPVISIDRSSVTQFNFRNRTERIYEAARVSYQNPATKQLITQTASAPIAVATGDVLKLPQRVENAQAAAIQAAAALHQVNMLQITGTLRLPATIMLTAGNNLTVRGFGANDGTYHIQSAKHRLDRSTGYSSEIEIRRLGN